MNDKENEIFLFVTFYVFYAMSQLAWMVARKPGVGRYYEILYKYGSRGAQAELDDASSVLAVTL